MRFDPYDPELHQNPYPVYRRLRDEFPVHYEKGFDFYTLSRWDDVQAALLDPETFCSGRGIAVGLGPGADAAPTGAGRASSSTPLLIMSDGARHDGLRKLVSRAFTPRRVARLEPRIREITRSLLDAFADHHEADLVRDFSAPLPTIVIAELLGVPVEDQAMFKDRSQRITQFDPNDIAGVHPDARTGPAFELAAYLSRILDERRRHPREDLLSALLAAEIDGRRLDRAELIGFAFLLLVAGNETTTNLISNAAILLDQHPETRARLIAEPGLIPRAVEEFVRFESPVQGLARTTTCEVKLHDTIIPEGKKVLLLFASANRDERRIPDPDRLDVSRHPNPHLGFGFGAHFCLGAGLARLEARVAFEELLARLPRYRLTQSHVDRIASGPIRGAARLPIATGG